MLGNIAMLSQTSCQRSGVFSLFPFSKMTRTHLSQTRWIGKSRHNMQQFICESPARRWSLCPVCLADSKLLKHGEQRGMLLMLFRQLHSHFDFSQWQLHVCVCRASVEVLACKLRKQSAKNVLPVANRFHSLHPCSHPPTCHLICTHKHTHTVCHLFGWGKLIDRKSLLIDNQFNTNKFNQRD